MKIEFELPTPFQVYKYLRSCFVPLIEASVYTFSVVGLLLCAVDYSLPYFGDQVNSTMWITTETRSSISRNQVEWQEVLRDHIALYLDLACYMVPFASLPFLYRAWVEFQQYRSVVEVEPVLLKPMYIEMGEIKTDELGAYGVILIGGKPAIVRMAPTAAATMLAFPPPKRSLLEMAMHGSSRQKADTPKCQVEIITPRGTNGSGFRYKDYLITALHVYTGEGSYTVQREQKAIAVGLSVPCFASPSADQVAFKLTPQQWARLGVTQALVKSASSMEVIQIYSRDEHGEMTVTHGDANSRGNSLFAMSHTATTSPGSSGSPVFSGSIVVAMHVGVGGLANKCTTLDLILSLTRDEAGDQGSNKPGRAKAYRLRSNEEFDNAIMQEETDERKFNQGKKVDIRVDENPFWWAEKKAIVRSEKLIYAIGAPDLVPQGSSWADFEDEFVVSVKGESGSAQEVLPEDFSAGVQARAPQSQHMRAKPGDMRPSISPSLNSETITSLRSEQPLPLAVGLVEKKKSRRRTSKRPIVSQQ